jgi:hypothetical protein
MPKASYNAPSGATITVDGTQDEVVAVLHLLEAGLRSSTPRPTEPPKVKNGRTTPMGLLMEFIARGFFSTPKGLTAVRLALEEEGHFYPTTTLSPLLLRLVRRRELRRIKDKDHWMYVR